MLERIRIAFPPGSIQRNPGGEPRPNAPTSPRGHGTFTIGESFEEAVTGVTL
jgi:hypothetical protein